MSYWDRFRTHTHLWGDATKKKLDLAVWSNSGFLRAHDVPIKKCSVCGIEDADSETINRFLKTLYEYNLRVITEHLEYTQKIKRDAREHLARADPQNQRKSEFKPEEGAIKS